MFFVFINMGLEQFAQRVNASIQPYGVVSDFFQLIYDIIDINFFVMGNRSEDDAFGFARFDTH